MARSTYIPDDIWIRLRGLPSNAKLLYLYLLTNRQNNITGYYNFDAETAMKELKFEEQDFKESINNLVVKELIITDENNMKILLLDYLMIDKVSNINQFKGVNKQMSGIKPNRLHFDFFYELMCYAPKCLDHLDDIIKHYLANNFESSGSIKDKQIESWIARKLTVYIGDDYLH
ncbi:MAG: hypothetical protein AAGU75_00510 [Bacillota bacterium]